MRWCIAIRVGNGDPKLGTIALGEMQPWPLAGAFFQLCRETCDLTEQEQAIEAWLRNRVRDAMEDRNNYAHGDWWVGLPGDPDPWLARTKPRTKAAAEKTERVPVGELDDKADGLVRLLMLVQTFGLICLEQPVVRANSPTGQWRGVAEPVRVGDALEKHNAEVRLKPPRPSQTLAERRRNAARRAIRPQ